VAVRLFKLLPSADCCLWKLLVSAGALYTALCRFIHSLLTWSSLGTFQGFLSAFAKFRRAPNLQQTTIDFYTTSLTFNNSTFCPYSVFMCFVWNWEETAIISLYSINWRVFITQTECVYSAVRTESLNILQVTTSVYRVEVLTCNTILKLTLLDISPTKIAISCLKAYSRPVCLHADDRQTNTNRSWHPLNINLIRTKKYCIFCPHGQIASHWRN